MGLVQEAHIVLLMVENRKQCPSALIKEQQSPFEPVTFFDVAQPG